MQGFVKKFNAETMQAVPNMLELVPHGVNKGSGMRKLLANLELPVEVNLYMQTHSLCATRQKKIAVPVSRICCQCACVCYFVTSL